jgi:hypothetical protein
MTAALPVRTFHIVELQAEPHQPPLSAPARRLASALWLVAVCTVVGSIVTRRRRNLLDYGHSAGECHLYAGYRHGPELHRDNRTVVCH